MKPDKIEQKLEQLADAVGTRNSFVSDVMDRIEKCPVQPGKKQSRNVVFRRILMKTPVKFTAAAVIIITVLTGIYQLTGSIDGASVAWADVLEQISTAKSVTYKYTLETEKFTVTSNVMQTVSGFSRTEIPRTGAISIKDHNTGSSIFLRPKTQSVQIQYMINREASEFTHNRYAWLKTLHRREAEFVGEEILDGSICNVYESRYPYSLTTLWVDPETNLPVKVVCEALVNTNMDFTIPEIILSVRDFGAEIETFTGADGKRHARGGLTTKITAGSGSRTRGFGLQEPMTITYHDFNWNVDLDESLFSMTYPQDYKVHERTIDVSERIEGEDALVYALDFWTTMSNNQFPVSIDDIGDPNVIKPMILKIFDKDGNPEDEWKAACDETRKIFKGLSFVLQRKVEDAWGGYSGRGVTLGQADKIICWWFDDETESYKAIFGDLRIQEVTEAQLPKQP